MKIDELADLAKERSHVYLIIPRKRVPTGRRIRLLSRSGPYGEICQVKQTDRGFDVVAVFESKSLSEFLEANT